MRYSADHKQKSRDRVIDEAAKALRTEGPRGLSVARVMGAAGLTHGGFYAHFGSRDDLLSAGLDRMFEQARATLGRESGADLPPEVALANYIGFYLSRAHRDSRETGCPLPVLAAEAPRLGGAMRDRYAEGVAGLTGAIADLLRAMGRLEPELTAASAMAEMVGAIALARAEPDSTRSDAILKASKSSLKTRLGLEGLH